MMGEQRSTLIRLGGLWESDGRGGKYLSGRFGGVRVYIFGNRHRRGDKDPTHVICIGDAQDRPAERRDDRQATGSSAGEDLGF